MKQGNGFEGKKALITGASRGIGNQIAKLFLQREAEVFGICSPNMTSPLDPEITWKIGDLSQSEDIRDCADWIKSLDIDILINNAGINIISEFSKISLEDFSRIQAVNLTAPFMFCQAAAEAMERKQWGRVVNVSSIWGKISKEYRAAYSSSKFALDGLTIAFAAEYASSGVLANCVAPGFTDTEMTRKILDDSAIAALTGMVPAKRLADPSEIAMLICWLCSEENTYLTGQNIAIDGGFSRAQ